MFLNRHIPPQVVVVTIALLAPIGTSLFLSTKDEVVAKARLELAAARTDANTTPTAACTSGRGDEKCD